MDIHLADGDSFRIFDAVEVPHPSSSRRPMTSMRSKPSGSTVSTTCSNRSTLTVQRALAKLERLSKGERRDYGFRSGRWPRHGTSRLFLVHVRDRIIPLRREQIAYCYTSNEKVTACTYEGVSYPLDKTLETLQAILPEADFFRANRQFIVARRAVKEIAVWFGSRLALHLTVGTPNASSFQGPRPRIQGLAHFRSTRRIVGSPCLSVVWPRVGIVVPIWLYLCIVLRAEGVSANG